MPAVRPQARRAIPSSVSVRLKPAGERRHTAQAAEQREEDEFAETVADREPKSCVRPCATA